MNKNAIKKFATEARRELISRVSQRALKYGISEKEVGNTNDDSINGHLLSSTEKKQRAALIEQIKEKGYEQVMEEVAYTWFNRFSALRFMEVNGYLPTRVRVFTDENNAFKPQILTEAIHMELDGLDMEKVYAYKEANDDDELYKYLLITQCNALNNVLPGMFQKIADYTELLFPDNLLREGSVVQQMIELIPEEDWKDAVQIIGWLYQYYNTELFNSIFDGDKSRKSLEATDIPAATQLFTPDWAVRYMVENSLGRLWLEGHPDDELQSQWKCYLEEAEQEPDVQAQLATICEEYKALKPEEILCIDPCSGSGHILAYMFDVLVQIYEAYGVDTRTAVASIVENNIYGLDIDDRAAQLAYFSVMMKACQYDKRFLRRKIQPHVYAIVESNHVDPNVVDYFCNGDAKLKEAMDTIINELHDAKEYGSIIAVSQQDWETLYARFDEIENESVLSIYTDSALGLKPMIRVAEALAQKYHVVITNPPYLNSARMNNTLLQHIKTYYEEAKADFASVMYLAVQRNFSRKNGYISFITTNSWMYLKSFSKVREISLKNLSFVTIADYGTELFDGKIGHLPIVAWTSRNARIDQRLTAVRLVDYRYGRRNEKYTEFYNLRNHYYATQSDFFEIDGAPIVYWFSGRVLKSFEKKGIGQFAEIVSGMTTGDNDKYLRFWHELNVKRIAFDRKDVKEVNTTYTPWIPYHKGGEQRKWFGNNEYVVNWGQSKNFNRAKTTMTHVYLKPCITWSDISGNSFAGRYCSGGFMFDVKGSCAFASEEKLFLLIGLFNSKITPIYVEALNPTSTTQVGDLKRIPFIEPSSDQAKVITSHTTNCISISKHDWDSTENSWDFQHHPLLRKVPTIAEAFDQWKTECDDRFNQLRTNEKELNRIFIDIYGLQDELTPEVEDKDITVRKADLGRDIRSFISYAVGCMFGRYSLDVEGLAYAGGEWDASKYASFPADKDNIIPICDDEYFEDDIVGLFLKFVKTVYGADTLDENLKFIADALGGKGQPKDVIRNYFLNDFYSDHCKIYQKRPIYWLFDSGKKNGFKALIYMHRYQPDTIARIRTDYVHEQQARYRTAIADLETRIANASTSERVKLNKQLKTLNDQATEIHEYEEKIHHLADQMISIDLDDGVKKNYAIFQDVLAKIK